MRRARAVWFLAAAVAFGAVVPWEELTEGDWLYAAATRFAQLEGHRVHYPTPTAELARLLEAGPDPAAPRHLADARLALGDRPGALDAMRRWAGDQGPRLAELARWAAAHQEPGVALEAAERALPGLPEDERRALADERIQWAQRHPELADPITLMGARARLFPGDGAALETWVRALERAGRLDEAGRALVGAEALGPERRLLLAADLKAVHGDPGGAFQLLDAAVEQPWSLAFRKAYALRADPAAPAAWRAALEARFDAPALVRLATWFQGRDQGGAAADLLRQVERRHGAGLARPDWLLLARLYGELDAVPEAFRAALAAARAGTPGEQTGDLADLARLALRAGGRPLAWGNYNDESYRWVASLDRTPGFWTGAVAFLLTGVAWKDTLERLEDGSLAERTFATARALADALTRRAPDDPRLPGLRLAIMERHVERGEGRAALDLLPGLEAAAPEVADAARRAALLAAQSAALPRAEEARLFKARLRHAAPAGSPGAPYLELLNGAIARMDTLDPSHRAALDLVLTELDRLPEAEELWLDLAARLESWNLDDDLGPRFQQALERFQGPGVWARAARWYARRQYQAELRRLGAEVAARFRGSALFQRADGAGAVTVAAPGPAGTGRARMVLWADWVRLAALERFPHSPRVLREAGRLVAASRWREKDDPPGPAPAKVIVPDALLRDRRWAVLFADAGVREAWFQEAMRARDLEARLEAMEAAPARTPVQDLLLFEGWARLSRFERAAAPGDRLAAAYPGDGALALRVLGLHRSLNALEAGHAGAARALVERTAPALEDAGALWTELGEMAEERGRPAQAMELWGNLVGRETRDPRRIAALSTLLWDYGHDREALAALEAGRAALGRPRFNAFEAGVLRENLRDLEGAVREYLDAARPEDPDAGDSWYSQDQRALRRLAQLLTRERVFRLVAGRVQGLAPGDAAAERTFISLFPLAALQEPDLRIFEDDEWIDRQDHPVDPMAVEARQAAAGARRPAEAEAIGRMGGLLLDKLQELVPAATSVRLLDFAAGQETFLAGRWDAERMVGFQDRILARRAGLAPTEEGRVAQEMARARFLAEHGRVAAADAVWAGLGARIARLSEGAPRIQAEAGRAGYLERAKGAAAAAEEWRRLSASHPWSLGLLEDRLAFLARAGLDEEGRALLEGAAARAGAGYREDLLGRLAQAALEAHDTARGRRAAEQLLALEGLDAPERLRAAHLLARFSFQAGPWDPAGLIRALEPQLTPEHRADLRRELARAADLERAPALALWIEALNRRPVPAWLGVAARSAARTGQGPALLDFFQRQRERSPRDARWSVALRELRRHFHDVPGAIEAAQAAVRVRPDDEALWRAAAELMVRAGRVREAADYLAGWNRPRPADEGVARWRCGLYLQAGAPDQALALEQAALAAFAREAPGHREELAERRARSADRLFSLGQPERALRLLTGGDDAAGLARTRLPAQRQAELALATGQFPRLLEARGGDPEFLAAAGAVLARHGRPEQLEAVLARLVQRLLPGGRPDGAALARWWPLVDAAGLEGALRAALAEHLLRARAGPWQADPGFPLVREVGAMLIQEEPEAETPARAFREPDLAGLWCRDLARRGQDVQLLDFTAPHWRALAARVRGSGPAPEAEPWTAWMQDAAVLQSWARAAAERPEVLRDLAEFMGERRLWDRFWALGARRWAPQPLLSALPAPARARWFTLWEVAEPAHQAALEQVGLALDRLLQAAPGAADDPIVVRLRGPRTVGAVLDRDARWTWPAFPPQGQGADLGRVPGALWGEHPADPWFVLETLARYRQGDPDAPRVPLAAPRPGAHALLALRLARAMKETALALELADAGTGQERPWLEAKLALLAAERPREAAAFWRAHVRAAQGSLTEAAFRDLAGLAGRLGLPGPVACLDPEQPVGPALLAYLHDLHPGAAARLRTADPMSFRIALSRRWSDAARLTPAQLRTWLQELWIPGVAGLPEPGLARLGPLWPHAVPWLREQAPPERQAALQALERAMAGGGELPARLGAPERPDGWRLLALRLLLARGESGPALALFEARLAELGQGRGLSWDPGAGLPGGEFYDEPMAAALSAWLEPFPAASPARERCRAFLARRRQEDRVGAGEWRLALRLCPPAQAPQLLEELERAWFRGEVWPGALPNLLPAMAALAPGAVPGWMARCPDDFSGPAARSRASVLITLRQPAQAAQVLLEARRRGLWSAQDEVEAFDLWRRAALPGPAPESWRGALAVWRGGPLGARLKAHPLDLLGARRALESLAPLAEDEAGRAALALGRSAAEEADDPAILRLRAGRWLLARAPGAAWEAFGVTDPGSLARRLAGRKHPARAVDAVLADLARAAAQAGDPGSARALLALLAERGAPELPALAAQLRPPRSAPAFRMVDGRPAPLRPRDLTWAMLTEILDREGAP